MFYKYLVNILEISQMWKFDYEKDKHWSAGFKVDNLVSKEIHWPPL